MRSIRAGMKKGMTLVEILFAFAIITTVITLAYASGLRAWRLAQAGNQRTQAQYIAQDALERVKALRESHGFQWSAGSTGFLQTINNQTTPGKSFYVELCGGSEVPSCTWKVASLPNTNNPSGQPAKIEPDAATRVSDNTDFYVYIVVTSYFKFVDDPIHPELSDVAVPGFPTNLATDDIQALSLEAHVEWTDATGVPSNLVDTTILTQGGDSL